MLSDACVIDSYWMDKNGVLSDGLLMGDNSGESRDQNDDLIINNGYGMLWLKTAKDGVSLDQSVTAESV